MQKAVPVNSTFRANLPAPIALVLVFGWIAALAPGALADTEDDWQGGNGNWSLGSNWSTGMVPGTSDDAYLFPGSSSDTVTFDGDYSTTSLGDLYLESLGTGLDITLEQDSNNTMSVTGSEEIGFSGAGLSTYNQSNGSNIIGSELDLAFDSAATAAYNLSGTGSLSVAGDEIVGDEGSGTFTQTGGTNSAGGNLVLGEFGSGSGAYSLSDPGTLSITGDEIVGEFGSGTFTQTGGTNSAAALVLGVLSSSTGAFSLSDPGSLTVSTDEIVGELGSGVFTQDGGTNSVGGDLVLGLVAGSTGGYTLEGTGSLTVSGDEIVGESGTGAFTQDGGTNSVTGTLVLGDQSGSSALYSLSSGSLSVGGDEEIGSGAVATFLQTGGTNTITGSFTVTGSGSSYTILTQPGVSASLSAAAELVGDGAEFVQIGGTNIVGTLLQVGDSGSTSTYILDSGTLTAPQELIGSGGQGDEFSQNGGANIVSTSLLIDSGTYSLLGGTLAAPTTVGNFVVAAPATFQMGGGAESGYLQNFGTFTYQGGAFNGTLENDGTTTLEASFSAGLGIINNTLIVVPSGSSAYGGGTIGFDNEGELDIANSTIGGTSLLNDGLISGYGTINGANFTNYGLVTQGAGNLTLSATGTNQNFGNIDLASGRQFRLTGATLTNKGSLTLGGGIVAGTSALDNSVGGVVTGPGSVLVPFSNDVGATIQQTAGTLNISHAFTNSGLISLGGATANITGPAITNIGTIEGVGNLGTTAVTNDGIIEAIGGTLGVNGALTNPAAGQILAGTGGKVLVSDGLTTNAGLINLTGGTYDNNNYALSNTGEISGYGTFRSGGLNTAGSVTFAGGVTTVNGPVTETAGTINTYNPTNFTGAVSVNGGTFTTHETQTVFAGGLSINGGTFNNDPGTVQTTNLTVAASGTLTGGSGATYQVSGNVSNMSTQFQLATGTLTLLAGTSNAHIFTWTVNTGVEDIGTLNIASGQTVDFENGGNSNAAVSVLSFQLADAKGAANPTALQADISSDLTGNLTIYYDPNTSSDSYLDDMTYTFGNGGVLDPEAVPEPSTWALLLAGLGLLVFWRHRARRTSG